MIRAVLFDAVGTLVHLREPVGETYARFAREAGVRIAPAQLQRTFVRVLRSMPPMAFPGDSSAETQAAERDWWRTVVRSVFDAEGAQPFTDFESFFDRLFAHYSGAGAWRCADHAVDTLAALRARGLRTGLVSNFDHRLPALLDSLGLAPWLDTVVLPADAGAAKPDPRIFALALSRLGVRAGEALYVGDDAEDDVGGATRAGLQAVDVGTLPDLCALEALVGAPHR